MKFKSNRIIAVLLSVITIISAIPITVSAEEADLKISTLSEFQQFAADVNNGNTYEGKTVVLNADIALGGESSPWTPIGNETNRFKGTFNGENHVVSGLFISDSSGKNLGLFGYVENGAVESLTVKGSVYGSGNVAGIVGYLSEGNVINCGNNADVTGSSAVAGVVGYVGGASSVSGCYNSGSITGTTGYIGGVTGQHWRAGSVENCYNTGVITGPATVGGVVGGHKAASPTLTNCYNAGMVIDSAGNSNNIGAVIGASRGTNSGCFYLKGTGTDTKDGITETEILDADILGSGFKSDDDNLNGGYPILAWQIKIPDLIIGSYEELKAFADSVNEGNTYEGKLIRLDVNVYLGGSSNPWTPAGTSASPFKGIFDGNYHIVSGLYINGGSSLGFFGAVDGGIIRNLVVSGSVTGSGDIAGIAGKLTAGKIINCGNEASISGSANVGGIVGSVNGDCTVSGCYNSGSVSGTTGYIGGVTGQHWRAGSVENCYNTGVITGPATVGGVSGGHKAASPTLVNCYNAGMIIDSAGNSNNIGAVIGASRGTNSGCYYIKGTGTDTKAGISETESLSASVLGDAFADGQGYPSLRWESSVCTDKTVRPAFTESTELSAQLAGYIKEAVASTKKHSDISGTLLGNDEYMSGASSTGTDWMALAMGRFGYYDSGEYYYLIDDGTGYEDYLSAMQSYIEKTYSDNGGILHSAKATEWHRAVVTIAALGGNPVSFGTYNGSPINLIADGSYSNSLKAGPGTQGINGWIWGLIAMDTGMYEVPSDAKYTRETFISEILKMQLTDGVNGNEYGGWVLGGYGSSSDVDITAMAIQALAPYYNDDTIYTYTNENSNLTVSKTVRQCVDEALDRLGSMMNKSGGFTSWNTNNVESIAQVVVALCSLGIDPAEDERFITSDGKTLLDGMLSFRLSDGGFCHVLNSGWNSMANDQATYALVSYWRFENGMRSLYDMRGDWTTEEKDYISSAVSAIDSISDPSSPDYKEKLKSALSVFRSVPENERRYVNNYSYLASALELIGGESELDKDTPYITSISVTKNPDKLRYYEGDSFDSSGMIVMAVYSDGSSNEISEYKISVKSALELGCDTVYISYGVLKTSVSIEVREKMPWDGEGTEDDPYLIKTADDLIDLRSYIYTKNMNTSGVYFKMTQDINMKNIDDWRGIADNASEGFRGHFDGNGCQIWNLNGSTYNACGLFGRLGDGAVIENLTIASGNLGGSYNTSIGAVAGEVISGATVTIKNCHSYVTVSGTFGIGGILGSVEDGASVFIENCTNHGTVKASYTGGGIVGQSGPNRWKNNGAKAVITNCYNAGEISGSGSWGLGGIVGSFRLGGTDVNNLIKNCYNVGTVSGGTAAGAVFGSAAETAVNFENVYYLNTSNTKIYGIFTDDGSDSEATVSGEASVKTETEMRDSYFVSLLGTAFSDDGENINSGYPVLTDEKPIGAETPVRAGTEIATAEELAAFAERVNAGESFTNKTVLLTAHIDLSDYSNWTPIGKSSSCQFDGIFDGQGYVIDNLYSKSGGLFGYAGTNAVIRNTGVASGEIEAPNSSFIGGIVGWSNGADIINCYNGADIYCGGYSGGIVGTVRDGGESTITGCYNSGNIYSSHSSIGGIAGHLDVSRNGTSVNVAVYGCYNSGTVTANDNAAGIVGRVQDGHTIRNCYNTGTITVTGENIIDGAGAIVSLITNNNEITDCYYNSDFTDCGVSNGTDNTAGKTSEQMKSDEFSSLLGDGFKPDRYALVNNGYPLVYWQNTEGADAVDAVTEKINTIGIVTVDSSDSVNEARNAFDNLEDELKVYVSNLETLEKAESELMSIQTLEQAKKTAVSQLETYKNTSDYRNEQIDEIESIVSSGKNAIYAAADTDAVNSSLADAKAKLDAVKTDKQLTDEETAKAVSDIIDSIGTVTADSEEAIKSARSAYENLSDEAKLLVSNYSKLENAESVLAQLKKEADDKKPPVNDPDDDRNSDDNENPDSNIPDNNDSDSNTSDDNISDNNISDNSGGSGNINSSENNGGNTSSAGGTSDGNNTDGDDKPVSPQTGDSSNISLYAVLTAVSLYAIVIILAKSKRKV